MNLLLDAHALLWWLADAPELSAEARDAIADGSNEVTVSAATAWELSIKRAAGKLHAPEDLAGAIASSTFRELPITIEHALAAGALPRHHADPFDRMLVAQAQAEGLTVVTRDTDFDAYDVPVLRA